MNEKTIKIAKIAIFFVVLIFIFFMVYSPHFNYKYPYHSDEWHHIAEIVSAEKGNFNVNPYFIEQPKRTDYEIGFHVIMALFFKITGIDPVLSWRFFPAIFACLSAVILFIFINKISDFKTGILSMLFFSTLKSNVNILGLWFFVPMSFVIPLFYLTFFFFVKFVDKKELKEKKKFLILSFITLFIILISHAPTAMFIAPILLIYLVYRFFGKEDRKSLNLLIKNRFIYIFLIVSFFIILLSFILFWHGSLAQTLKLFYDFLIFEKGFTPYEIRYSLFFFYGPVAFILAMFGIISSLKNNKKIIFTFSFILSAILILIFSLKEISLLAPYQRVLYYSLLSLAPLSAFGVSALFNTAKKIKIKWIYILALILIFIILLLSFYTSFFYYNKLPETSKLNVQLYKLITDEDYKAIIWLKKNFGEGNLVLARPHISSAIYPISENYVFTITPAHLGGEYIVGIDYFFSSNCDFKYDFLDRYEPDFVFSRQKINCGFKEIYSQNVFIYDVRELKL
ncbi:MAG: DUF6541 family protein [Candidatus Pacearchaeota archaeon]